MNTDCPRCGQDHSDRVSCYEAGRRSAPSVTDEMVTAAMKAYGVLHIPEADECRHDMRKAISAALSIQNKEK